MASNISKWCQLQFQTWHRSSAAQSGVSSAERRECGATNLKPQRRLLRKDARAPTAAPCGPSLHGQPSCFFHRRHDTKGKRRRLPARRGARYPRAAEGCSYVASTAEWRSYVAFTEPSWRSPCHIQRGVIAATREAFAVAQQQCFHTTPLTVKRLVSEICEYVTFSQLAPIVDISSGRLNVTYYQNNNSVKVIAKATSKFEASCTPIFSRQIA